MIATIVAGIVVLALIGLLRGERHRIRRIKVWCLVEVELEPDRAPPRPRRL